MHNDTRLAFTVTWEVSEGNAEAAADHRAVRARGTQGTRP
jgi:hypothetical protein